MRTLLQLSNILLLTFALCSCSHEHKLARAQRKLANLVMDFPELVHTDTISKLDTTIVPGVVHDTIFKTTITKDTITIIDKQLTIKYFNDGKTTYLKGICDTIKIIKEIPVVVNTVGPVQIITEATWYDKYIIRPFAAIAFLFILIDQIAAYFQRKPKE